MMMEACKCSTEADSWASAKSDSPSSAAAPRQKVSVPNATTVAICLVGEPENGVRAQSNRPAAQGIEPDVVADRVAHEGDQREPRVRHARAGELAAPRHRTRSSSRTPPP